MKGYIRKLVVGSLIIGGAIFAFSDKTNGLEDKVNEKEKTVQVDNTKKEAKADTTKIKQKTREYDSNINFLLNELVTGGSFYFKGEKERFLNEKEVGFVDNFSLSYGHTVLHNGYGGLLKEEKKEKKLLALGYHVSYKEKPFIDIYYTSDKSIQIYSTFLTGGLGKQFSNGLSIEGALGMKVGNINWEKEKYDVIKTLIKYKTPKKDIYNLDAFFKCYLQRKNLDNLFGGWYMMEGGGKISIDKKIFGVKPVIGFNFRKDKIQNVDILRYEVTLGFLLKKGGKVTLQ